jgi:branched-chain amino acid transport system ATP-binding protein
VTEPALAPDASDQTPAGDAPLLEINDLHAAYGAVRVLHGLSLTVGHGEVVVVLGANGAGKTTTLRAISGIVESRGDIVLDGVSLRGSHPEDIVRRGVAHVPQGRGTVTGLSVEDNLRLGAYIRKDDEVESDLERWYDTFPRLRERREQPAGNLSGGEQQMLAIARALMSRPRLLLLDEPSLGLAPLIVREVFEILEQIRAESGTAMLVVEQNAQLALGIAARAYVLEAGVIAVGGPAAELRGNESIRRAYLGY